MDELLEPIELDDVLSNIDLKYVIEQGYLLHAYPVFKRQKFSLTARFLSTKGSIDMMMNFFIENEDNLLKTTPKNIMMVFEIKPNIKWIKFY